MTITETQRSAVECPKERLIISAVAGSGKTSVLIERIATAIMPYAAGNAKAPQMTATYATDAYPFVWDRDEWRRNMAVEAVAQAKALITELDREDA